MARNHDETRGGVSRLRRMASAVGALFSRGRKAEQSAEAEPRSGRDQQRNAASTASTPRTTRRETDIPLETLDRTYTPPATSSKASFRSDGSDHGRDQEFALGIADDRWNDEDRITNKSGDPRIGTHRRTYEPAEERGESRE